MLAHLYARLRPARRAAAPDQHRRRRRRAPSTRASCATTCSATTCSTPSSGPGSRSTRCGRSTGTTPEIVAVTDSAPKMVDRLSAADAEHFEEVRRLLDGAAIDYVLDPRLVRGLDYYTRTVFEFRCDVARRAERHRRRRPLRRPDRAARRARRRPAAGWATGLERIAQALRVRRRASRRAARAGRSGPPGLPLHRDRAAARASASSGRSRSCARRGSAPRWTSAPGR